MQPEIITALLILVNLIQLNTTLENVGSTAAYNVNATLICADPYIFHYQIITRCMGQ